MILGPRPTGPSRHRYGRLWPLPLLTAVLLASPALAWDTIAPGVRSLSILDGGGQAFELDLSRLTLRVAEARSLKRSTASVSDLAKGTGALIAINGGFFDERSAPLGLLVSGGRPLNKLRRTDSGVFYITPEGVARLVHTSDFDAKAPLDFAIQASPRLVVEGSVMKLKPQWDRRTALGVRVDQHHVVLAVIRQPISLEALAQVMRNELECPFAVALDGGSSTQLWSSLPDVDAVIGFSVANAVLAIPKVPK